MAGVPGLQGVIDLHVHGGPDVAPRRHSDIELACRAKSAGMSAIVLKSHVESTVGRAALATEAAGFPVFGGLVLNPFVAGGIDLDVVELSLELGARIIWLPTIGSQAHVAAFGQRGVSWAGLRRHPSQPPASWQATPLRLDDRPAQTVIRAICRRIARAGAVLATGHLDERAIGQVAAIAAASRTRLLVTHPDYVVPGMAIPAQVHLAREQPGVFFERTAYATSATVIGRVSIRHLMEAIRATGIERNVLTSDHGQPSSPPYPRGLAELALRLGDAGMSGEDLQDLLVKTPARLLGFGSAGASRRVVFDPK